MENKLEYQFREPNNNQLDFVHGFSSISNLYDFNQGIIIPNGRIDLVCCKTKDSQFQILLMGLETVPKAIPKRDIQTFFAISFNPLALEYILQDSIADILNIGKKLPGNFWDFDINDLDDFDGFCDKATKKIDSLLPKELDKRKCNLFKYIFENDGNIAVKELSEKVCWSERQINRYFNQKLGISLKAYCNILRFQAALPYIKQGQLAPHLDNYTDQSHFIKEIKKLSGVSPKELFKNENDRFLQFLVYPTS